VKNSDGEASDPFSVQIKIEPVTANLVASPGSGTAPLAVAFTIAGSSSGQPGEYEYKLAYGDGSPDSIWDNGLQVPDQPHLYLNPGEYFAVLTAKRKSDSGTSTDKILIACDGGETARLQGTVYEYRNLPPIGGPESPLDPKEGFEVKLYDEEGGVLLATAITDASGIFEFMQEQVSGYVTVYVISTEFETNGNGWLPGARLVNVADWLPGDPWTGVSLSRLPGGLPLP
jgi:hypothetical protein